MKLNNMACVVRLERRIILYNIQKCNNLMTTGFLKPESRWEDGHVVTII